MSYILWAGVYIDYVCDYHLFVLAVDGVERGVAPGYVHPVYFFVVYSYFLSVAGLGFRWGERLFLQFLQVVFDDRLCSLVSRFQKVGGIYI